MLSSVSQKVQLRTGGFCCSTYTLAGSNESICIREKVLERSSLDHLNTMTITLYNTGWHMLYFKRNWSLGGFHQQK